ncbi:MAG: hypothetical protein J0H74_14570 [Chitinophagaceae bacterium]|nr:hypothetical protein [Chitinophagaceae bacterium]
MQLQKILLGIIFTGGLLKTPAQQPSGKQQAVAQLQTITERYRNFKGLHFSVRYRYAEETKPSVWLDSLKGDFAIYGDQYHYSLDSTEFISGKELSVILFKQDQLMYLAKGTSALQQGNPIALLDSLLLKNNDVDGRMQETKDERTIIFSFHPGQKAKRVEYVVDKTTGYITKMISVVPARELYDPSVQQKVEGDAYAIVETSFTDFRQEDPTGKGWDLSRLFKKEGKEYIPLPPYDAYKIVLGSPDL